MSDSLSFVRWSLSSYHPVFTLLCMIPTVEAARSSCKRGAEEDFEFPCQPSSFLTVVCVSHTFLSMGSLIFPCLISRTTCCWNRLIFRRHIHVQMDGGKTTAVLQDLSVIPWLVNLAFIVRKKGLRCSITTPPTSTGKGTGWPKRRKPKGVGYQTTEYSRTADLLILITPLPTLTERYSLRI